MLPRYGAAAVLRAFSILQSLCAPPTPDGEHRPDCSSRQKYPTLVFCLRDLFALSGKEVLEYAAKTCPETPAKVCDLRALIVATSEYFCAWTPGQLQKWGGAPSECCLQLSRVVEFRRVRCDAGVSQGRCSGSVLWTC